MEALEAHGACKPSSGSSRRSKKRKKKKKLPRTGGARRLHRRWHVHFAGFAGRAVFPSVDVRPKMLGIKAGMDQKTVTWRDAALIVFGWFCWFRIALCSLVADRHGCSTSWSVWTRRTRTELVGFTGDGAPRCVFSFLVVRPKILGIMAGMDEKGRGVFSSRSLTSLS